MFVMNPLTGERFDFVEFVSMDLNSYEDNFGKNLPKPPFKDPIMDRFILELYNRKNILENLLYNKKNYGCFNPVFIDGKKIKITEFSYYKLIREILEEIYITKNEEYDSKIFDGWKKIVGYAIAKLNGNFYTSAGKD